MLRKLTIVVWWNRHPRFLLWLRGLPVLPLHARFGVLQQGQAQGCSHALLSLTFGRIVYIFTFGNTIIDPLIWYIFYCTFLLVRIIDLILYRFYCSVHLPVQNLCSPPPSVHITLFFFINFQFTPSTRAPQMAGSSLSSKCSQPWFSKL